MVYVLKEGDSLVDLLEEIKKQKKTNGSELQKSVCIEGKKKTLEKFYGCLIRGLDGLEYQKEARGEWD
jgi:hypothetical protein